MRDTRFTIRSTVTPSAIATSTEVTIASTGWSLPFDRLLELYRACPPRPESLNGPR